MIEMTNRVVNCVRPIDYLCGSILTSLFFLASISAAYAQSDPGAECYGGDSEVCVTLAKQHENEARIKYKSNKRLQARGHYDYAWAFYRQGCELNNGFACDQIAGIEEERNVILDQIKAERKKAALEEKLARAKKRITKSTTQKSELERYTYAVREYLKKEKCSSLIALMDEKQNKTVLARIMSSAFTVKDDVCVSTVITTSYILGIYGITNLDCNSAGNNIHTCQFRLNILCQIKNSLGDRYVNDRLSETFCTMVYPLFYDYVGVGIFASSDDGESITATSIEFSVVL